MCDLTWFADNGKVWPSTTTVHRNGGVCSKSLNPTTLGCGNDLQKGPPPQTCDVTAATNSPSPTTQATSSISQTTYVGNPINFATGNKFQQELDFSYGGNSTLNFTRSYNSADGIWRHNHATYLRFFDTKYVSLVMANGHESHFTINGTAITSTSGELGILSKTDTGWIFTSTSNERFTFDTSGKLTQWSNIQGAVHQLTYASNQVTVTDALGNSLSFTEDTNHQALALTATGVQITYGYNTSKRLTSVTRVIGGQTTLRQFHYEDPRNSSWLTGITDERGVRYATWRYDDQGRATSSEHADGADRVGVTYNSDGTVSVTNELGKVTKYSLQTIQGIRRIASIQGEPSANCPSSNSSFTYDSRGLLKTRTDNKGNLTTYEYNVRGLEISRTEAVGKPESRTIITDWHPTLFLPAVVTEPKRTTTYHYDDQGRQLGLTVSGE